MESACALGYNRAVPESSENVMGTGRLEAFSDGVIAVIITIMVLELKVPHDPAGKIDMANLDQLRLLLPVFFSYLLSFIYVGIYWNNHHHMMHVTTQVRGGVLWANLHLLFWMSLIPFSTAWMGENHFATIPTALYGVVLLMTGTAYAILQQSILCVIGHDSDLGRAVGQDWKGKLSMVLYVVAIGLAFVHVAIAHVIFISVATMWLVPDRRIEKVIVEDNSVSSPTGGG